MLLLAGHKPLPDALSTLTALTAPLLRFPGHMLESGRLPRLPLAALGLRRLLLIESTRIREPDELRPHDLGRLTGAPLHGLQQLVWSRHRSAL